MSNTLLQAKTKIVMKIWESIEIENKENIEYLGFCVPNTDRSIRLFQENGEVWIGCCEFRPLSQLEKIYQNMKTANLFWYRYNSDAYNYYNLRSTKAENFWDEEKKVMRLRPTSQSFPYLCDFKPDCDDFSN